MSGVHSQYPVSIRWDGARRGTGSSVDGLPDLSIGPPPSFGGIAGLWTPEHLFVLAATSCWLTTFLAVAAASKLDLAAVDCSGKGTLELGEDRRFRISAITLRPRVEVTREGDRDLALRLVQKAESVCLIRNSIRTEVTMDPEIQVAAESLVHA
ncbi:MAG: OsmC family protein [Vicinamibacteria bacterium]